MDMAQREAPPGAADSEGVRWLAMLLRQACMLIARGGWSSATACRAVGRRAILSVAYRGGTVGTTAPCRCSPVS